ncbi:MAG: tyrosine-protein phosphatase [Acidimicrobiales bacterium]|nr:tyrosine-protein phosphatase [Acidimicrobiales bacterium]
MVADPRVLIASANLRDLGGLATIDGQRVRAGRLFRSGHLSELDRAEAAILGGLGLRTIIDLRRPSEVADFPTPDLDGVDRLWMSVSPEDSEFAVAANLLFGEQPERVDTAEDSGFAVAANLLFGNQPEQVDIATMLEGYFRNTVTNRLDGYRPVFEAATDPDRQPLLFHCMGGKDRTGFVAGVLLRLLGVGQEEVMADYLLTNEILGDRMARRADQARQRIAQRSGVEPDQVDERHLEGIRAMLYTRPSFLQASFDAVTDKFGTWETFRRDGLGIDDARFSAFLDAVVA